jgi:hypothetical protein
MNKRIFTIQTIARPAALGIALAAAASSVAAAQDMGANNYNSFDPAYDSVNNWNTAWDSGNYTHHVLIGTIADFKPYRMLLQPVDPNGNATTVDLKNGTVIRPDGTQLSPGMRVAVMGYWSKGTFIANRVILRGT